MTGPSLTLAHWLLAAAPIAVVLVLMIFFRWGGSRAGPAGWLVAALIAATTFRAGPALLAYSQLEAVFLTLYVLYIIWMALLLFRVVETAGAIQVIGRGILRLTSDPLLQLLILAWTFSAFLQGVAGFGVPIAVVAPLLIGLGFDPVIAVASTAVGHSWSVTFGDIASSFNALIAASDMSGAVLAPWSAAMLGVACLLCGLAVAHLYRGGAGVGRSLAAILIIGGGMAVTQYGLAVNGLWNLAGFVAGMVGMALSAGVSRLALYRRASLHQAEEKAPLARNPRSPVPLWAAVLPYLVLIVVVSLAELWGPLHHVLNQVKLTAPFPAVETGLGWATPERMGKQISVFGHAGALLAYTSVIAFMVYLARGDISRRDVRAILSRTVRSAIPSSIGIASMVGMAMIMDRAGMTDVLARGLSTAVGALFPVVSPFIGLLGAFMTGSNTNSNVVFAPLQKATAQLIAVAIPVILAAQTTGGSLGSMLAPAKIIVGCSTAGLGGEEGSVMRKTVPYGLAITLIVGLIAWVATIVAG
jgi:lactate permease